MLLGRAEQPGGFVREPGVHHGDADGVRVPRRLPGVEGIATTLSRTREGCFAINVNLMYNISYI